jgi:uncharacterized membrane protein YhaH (DUF805 family)
MRADVEGFDGIREFGLMFLFQIICMAGLYMLANAYKEQIGFDGLGSRDFSITLMVVWFVTTYRLYKEKVNHMIKTNFRG